MKITIYELLGMIKDGKPPKKILYENRTYLYDNDTKDYVDYDKNYGLIEDHIYHHYGICNCLNDEVEILETTLNIKNMNITAPKKIEKLDYPHINIESGADDEIRDYLYKVKDKLDEIIDRWNNDNRENL